MQYSLQYRLVGGTEVGAKAFTAVGASVGVPQRRLGVTGIISQLTSNYLVSQLDVSHKGEQLQCFILGVICCSFL